MKKEFFNSQPLGAGPKEKIIKKNTYTLSTKSIALTLHKSD